MTIWVMCPDCIRVYWPKVVFSDHGGEYKPFGRTAGDFEYHATRLQEIPSKLRDVENSKVCKICVWSSGQAAWSL